MHFRGDNSASEDTATDRHETGERAFLICKPKISMFESSKEPLLGLALKSWGTVIHTDICALNRGLRRPEAQPDVLEPSSPSLPYSRALGPLALRILKDVRLLLECTLRLHCQLGCHDCGLLRAASLIRSRISCGSQS